MKSQHAGTWGRRCETLITPVATLRGSVCSSVKWVAVRVLVFLEEPPTKHLERQSLWFGDSGGPQISVSRFSR